MIIVAANFAKRGRRILPLTCEEADMRQIGEKSGGDAGARENSAGLLRMPFMDRVAISWPSFAAYRANKSGASAIEFALVVPFLFY
jgi:hypothetical protein